MNSLKNMSVDTIIRELPQECIQAIAERICKTTLTIDYKHLGIYNYGAGNVYIEVEITINICGPTTSSSRLCLRCHVVELDIFKAFREIFINGEAARLEFVCNSGLLTFISDGSMLSVHIVSEVRFIIQHRIEFGRVPVECARTSLMNFMNNIIDNLEKIAAQ